MYQYRATISRVIDGDTAVMDIDLGFHIWLRDVHLRLRGINTPERGKEGFQAATDFVKNFFDRNPKVIINVYGRDKYGRWLADVLDPEVSVTLNAQLVSLGLAKVYLV